MCVLDIAVSIQFKKCEKYSHNAILLNLVIQSNWHNIL